MTGYGIALGRMPSTSRYSPRVSNCPSSCNCSLCPGRNGGECATLSNNPPPPYTTTNQHADAPVRPNTPRASRPYPQASRRAPRPPTVFTTPPQPNPTIPKRIRHHFFLNYPRYLLLSYVITVLLLIFGCIYWHRTMTQEIANATVNPDSEYWVQQARIRAYEPCYEKMDSGYDPGFGSSECRETKNGTAVNCWAENLYDQEDRYPRQCLIKLGAKIKFDDLEKLKDSLAEKQASGLMGFIGATIFGPAILCFLITRATYKRRWAAIAPRRMAEAARWQKLGLRDVFRVSSWRGKDEET